MKCFRNTHIGLALILTLLCGDSSYGSMYHPQEWVGVWECKNPESGYVVVRFPQGRIVGVDFERTSPSAKWSRVGSFTGRWKCYRGKYVLSVERHLFTTGTKRKQELSYRVASQDAMKLALFPNYDAPSMLEVKVADMAVNINPHSYSPDALSAAYLQHFLSR